MAPITGTYDALLLYADVSDALVRALLPTALRDHETSSRLVFELGHQHDTGPPLIKLSFHEGKLQIPGIRCHGGAYTYKAALYFDSHLMTYSSKAIGLRASHAHFETSHLRNEHEPRRYVVKGVMEAVVETSNATHLDEANHLMRSPWVGLHTGKHSYQHAYQLDKPLSPPRSLRGTIRIHLPSLLQDTSYRDSDVDGEGWLSLPVRGVTVHAHWKLQGPTRLPS